MSDGILKILHPIARRRHKCQLCECAIEKGQRYERQTVSECGRVYDFICHEECSELISDLRFQRTWEDSADADSFQSGLVAYNEDFHHPEWNELDFYDQAKLVLKEISKHGDTKLKRYGNE